MGRGFENEYLGGVRDIYHGRSRCGVVVEVILVRLWRGIDFSKKGTTASK